MQLIKAFYRKASACVKVDGELIDSIRTRVGLRQGCAMSPCLFYIILKGCMRVINAKLGKMRVTLKMNGVDSSVAACMFVDDAVLLAERVRELQREVDKFHSVYSRNSCE